MRHPLGLACAACLLALASPVASAETEEGTDVATEEGTDSGANIGTAQTIGAGLNISGLTTIGITGKYFIHPEGAVFGTVAFHQGVSIQAGYVHTLMTLWDGGASGRVDLAVGGDGLFWFVNIETYEDEVLALRPLAEVAYRFADLPIEIAVDLGPTFYLVSAFGFDTDFDSIGISGRYFF